MKRIVLIMTALAAGLLCQAQESQFKWKTVPMDGSRAGVTVPNATNVKEAMGVVEKNVYTAPNGRKFKGGSVTEVARLMIAAQETMAPVKEVVGRSEEEMVRKWPQCALSNWFISVLMESLAAKLDRPVDIGIYNFGGIRCDMPKGDITADNILSMFPFNNHPSYVLLKGADVRALFEQMASTRIQVVGGVKVVIKDGRLESIMVGDQPLDDKKTYGVATIDFLLNGGDNLNIARNALDLVITEEKVSDVVMAEVRRLNAEGKADSGSVDDRITFIKSEE